MNHYEKLCVVVLLLVANPLPGAPTTADGLKGSAEFLRAIAEASKGEVKEKSKAEKLIDDLKLFRIERHHLLPKDAAKRWVELYDLSQGMSPKDLEGLDYVKRESLSITSVLGSIPPPASWKELATLIKKRATAGSANRDEVSLSLMMDYLAGDLIAARADIESFTPFLEKFPQYERKDISKALEELRKLLSGKEETLGEQAEQFEKALDTGLAGASFGEMSIPSLVEAVGVEKATAILHKALALEGASFSLPNSDVTRTLAKKIVIELAPKLKKLPWTFVDEIQDTNLYEALDARNKELQSIQLSDKEKEALGVYDRQESGRSTAGMVYSLGLVAKGQAVKANQVLADLAAGKEGLAEIPKDAILAMDRAGYSQQLFEFLKTYLDDKPSSTLWKTYVSLATRVGASNSLIDQIGHLQGRKGLPELIRIDLRSYLIDAYLGNDDIDKALAILRAELARKAPDLKGESRKAQEKLQWKCGIRMASMGFFLKKDFLAKEGFEWLRKNNDLEQMEGYGEDYYRAHEPKLPNYVDLLLRAGRYIDAEEYYLSKIRKSLARSNGMPYFQYGNGDPYSGLLLLYGKVGRHSDVLEILDNNPNWGQKDLIKLSVKVQRTVAMALADMGNIVLAQAILKNAIAEQPGSDELYAALLSLSPSGQVDFMDQLYLQDRFEERPLIWKAKILLNEGKLEEAEKIARMAVSVDPSDGEQGKGDRMRVYSVLSEILEKKGKAVDSKNYNEIVEAIRMSEDADDLNAVGLLRGAIKLYQKSLESFSDAYCIQSRMAVRLHDLGDFKEAEKYYARAYELMPDSFGRVESHCFGCERVFEGQQAESLAEKIFMRIRQDQPAKPQVHYLLGYLRVGQRRWKEAAESFWEAVHLDPDYLNAWKKLAETSSHENFNRSQNSDIALNLLRLSNSFEGRLALNAPDAPTKIWNIVRDKEKAEIKKPESLLPLKASSARQGELEKLGQKMVNYSENGDSEKRNPGKAVLSWHLVFQNVTRLMGIRSRYSDFD